MDGDTNRIYKETAGKHKLRLVLREIIRKISIIREFGVKKYGTEDGWQNVPLNDYRDALFRHLLCYLDNPDAVDSESELPHLWHIACNVSFLIELEENRIKGEKNA